SSIFQMAFDSMKSEEIQPLFIDFNKSLNQGQLPNEMTYSYVQNEINDLFELSYLMDYGTDNNKLLGLALSYLPYLGTSKYSNEELQKEWFKNGLSFSASSSRDKVYVSLSGIKGSFEEGLQLLEHVMEDIVKNDTALIELKNDIIKRRANAKLNKGQILFSGLLSFAKYGEKSPFTNSLDLEELMAVQSDTLIALIKDIFKNEHRVFLYSNNKKDLDLVSDKHTYKPRGIQIEDMVDYIELDQTKNSVLFTHYDMVQTEIILLSKDKKGFDLETLPEAYIFNEYFGSGLSSIVFQEIRESKALAYSSYCSYSFPKKKEDSNYVLAYLGTQTDKLGDAVAALLELMNDMPQAEAQFEQAKSSAMKSIASNRITKSSIFWNYEGLKKLGIDYDYREKIYNEIEEMTLSDLNTFFNNHIKGKQYTYAVIGDRDKVDFEALKKLGTVRELSLEEVFGY
ncbi:MAG: insulinase family protein, partial [Flavobacteriales bacterium]|nr:insulinase family protein [Flavobacteriales bacterium]